MHFTKKDLIKLLDNYGRAFYNPSLSGKSKQNFLKIIKAESFPLATVEELAEKFNFLYNKYNFSKSGSEKDFEYFSYVDKAVKLANQDYLPKETTIELNIDAIEEYIPVDVPISQKSKKRHHDEDIQAIAKKVRYDDNYELVQNNEIQCVKVDNSVLNGTDEIVEIKQKLNQLSNLNVMVKTLLDEQAEANKILVEIRTLLKSSIAGQKLQHEMDMKQYELDKSNEILLKQVLSILKENDSQK